MTVPDENGECPVPGFGQIVGPVAIMQAFRCEHSTQVVETSVQNVEDVHRAHRHLDDECCAPGQTRDNDNDNDFIKYYSPQAK